MAEKTWRRGQKRDYTDRPLTEEERAFAEDEKNYNLLFFYMRKWGLDEEEWYDILIIPYLQAVKKYHVYEPAKQYAFSTILKMKLKTAISNELRAQNRQKRKPEGGFVSLDYTVEGDNPFSEHKNESLWIDTKISVEHQVLLKMMFNDFYNECLERYKADFYKEELDMLISGYSFKKILRESLKKYGGCNDDGFYTWCLEEDIKKFRQCFKEVFGI